ncbi:hypothetical protein [Deinococcus roseus]|uniref:Carbohydrate-binding protein n=1 Tax=Deinococcus roseus TaxID=392414 RepID=A0ABQ2CTP3_9DEIO|nr:hypothetical protein [Deinococcus roseus]GGJ19571.1 hypothetical protein GCM10008938_02090 [Deinococcus roseus]
MKKVVWLAVLGLLTTGCMQFTVPSRDVVAYRDALGPKWENWSWDTTLDFSSTSVVWSGKYSIKLAYQGDWTGLYLHTGQVMNKADIRKMGFWVNGGPTENHQLLVVMASKAAPADENDVLLSDKAMPITAYKNTWTYYEIPLSELGNPTWIAGVVFQNYSSARSDFFLDDIVFLNK